MVLSPAPAEHEILSIKVVLTENGRFQARLIYNNHNQAITEPDTYEKTLIKADPIVDNLRKQGYRVIIMEREPSGWVKCVDE